MTIRQKREWLIANKDLTKETTRSVAKMSDKTVADEFEFWQDKIKEWQWDMM